jgi:hypothetical protein
MKPYKDKRFSIAVFDYGEYSYRESLSTITPNELRAFLAKHGIFDAQELPPKEALLSKVKRYLFRGNLPKSES